MVTSLNEDNESVTVEWIENGDTKGKEVNHRLLLLSGTAQRYYPETLRLLSPQRHPSLSVPNVSAVNVH